MEKEDLVQYQLQMKSCAPSSRCLALSNQAVPASGKSKKNLIDLVGLFLG